MTRPSKGTPAAPAEPDVGASASASLPDPPPQARLSALRVVAIVEGLKGLAALLAATGLLALLHRDLDALVIQLVEHAHLNPAAKYPHILIDAASHLDQPRLLGLAAGAVAYALVRFVESFGLYRQRAWAEWLAALGGGIYLPLELAEMVRRPSTLGLALLLTNGLVVAVMVRALLRRRSAPGASR